MKKEYLVLGFIKTNLTLEKGSKIKFELKQTDNVAIIISEIEPYNVCDNKESYDLQVTVQLFANNITESIIGAQSILENIADVIAFANNGRIEKCKCYKSMELTDKDKAEFSQFDYNILSNIAKKTADYNKIDSLFKSLTSTSEIQRKNIQKIERAIHYYQKGLSSLEVYDNFSNLWLSLECIIPILNEKYPNSTEKRKCEKCGYETEIKNSSALKTFFETDLNDRQLYSKARGVRRDIVHGLKDITDIDKEILEFIEEFEIDVYKTICILLGVDSTKDYTLADINEGMTFQFFITIGGYKLFDDKGKAIFPKNEIKMEIHNDNGELFLQPEIKTDIFNKGCGFSSLGWDCYGTCGQDIKKIQLTITN